MLWVAVWCSDCMVVSRRDFGSGELGSIPSQFIPHITFHQLQQPESTALCPLVKRRGSMPAVVKSANTGGRMRSAVPVVVLRG